MLCYMWEAPEKGMLKGTIKEIARIIGATNGDLSNFLSEAMKLEFDDRHISPPGRRHRGLWPHHDVMGF